MPLEAIGAIFALIDDARAPIPAVPNTRDRTSNMAVIRPNIPVIIYQRYRFPSRIARGGSAQTMVGRKLLVSVARLRRIETADVRRLWTRSGRIAVHCAVPFAFSH